MLIGLVWREERPKEPHTRMVAGNGTHLNQNETQILSQVGNGGQNICLLLCSLCSTGWPADGVEIRVTLRKRKSGPNQQTNHPTNGRVVQLESRRIWRN